MSAGNQSDWTLLCKPRQIEDLNSVHFDRSNLHTKLCCNKKMNEAPMSVKEPHTTGRHPEPELTPSLSLSNDVGVGGAQPALAVPVKPLWFVVGATPEHSRAKLCLFFHVICSFNASFKLPAYQKTKQINNNNKKKE